MLDQHLLVAVALKIRGVGIEDAGDNIGAALVKARQLSLVHNLRDVNLKRRSE